MVRPENARHWFCLGWCWPIGDASMKPSRLTGKSSISMERLLKLFSHWRSGSFVEPETRTRRRVAATASSIRCRQLTVRQLGRSQRMDRLARARQPPATKRLLTAAIDEFRKAIALDCRDQAHALSGIGFVYSPNWAVTTRPWLANGRRSPSIRRSLSGTCRWRPHWEASGDVARAIAEYKAALAIDPRAGSCP